MSSWIPSSNRAQPCSGVVGGVLAGHAVELDQEPGVVAHHDVMEHLRGDHLVAARLDVGCLA